jgi:hypothetical protein
MALRTQQERMVRKLSWCDVLSPRLGGRCARDSDEPPSVQRCLHYSVVTEPGRSDDHVSDGSMKKRDLFRARVITPTIRNVNELDAY